ncbi:MAG: UPF0175 family protein [Phycisphaerae bacterium]
MKITFELPDALDAAIETQLNGDAPRFAMEAMVIELYRTARISLGQVGALLGLTRIEAQTWLAGRGVPLNYDIGDLDADRRTLARLLDGASA